MKPVLITALFFLLLVNLSCKKYPEGGWSNNAKKHLYGNLFQGYAKTWSLVSYEVNGTDSTAYIRAGNPYTSFANKNAVFDYDYANNDQAKVTTSIYKYQVTFGKYTSTMTFTPDRNSSAEQCASINKCEREIFRPNGKSQEWTVRKLTEDELILTMSKEKLYKIVLSKI